MLVYDIIGGIMDYDKLFNFLEGHIDHSKLELGSRIMAKQFLIDMRDFAGRSPDFINPVIQKDDGEYSDEDILKAIGSFMDEPPENVNAMRVDEFLTKLRDIEQFESFIEDHLLAA